MMKTEIKRWGNSAAVRLPSKIIAAAHLEVSSPILLEVKEGKIVIEALPVDPVKKLNLPFSEADLLADLTSDMAHADALALISDVECGE